MKALDKLICLEERKIDYLTSIRNNSGALKCDPGEYCRPIQSAEIEHDIEKAYEQLAIYKIRKFMGF
jgi:hypothetical protein